MSAYLQSLRASVAAVENGQHVAAVATNAQLTRDRLVPLEVRLKRLLETIPPEVQAEGLSLEAIRMMLRGAQGKGAHAGTLGRAFRKLGYVRERRWRGGEGFSALWFPSNEENRT